MIEQTKIITLITQSKANLAAMCWCSILATASKMASCCTIEINSAWPLIRAFALLNCCIALIALLLTLLLLEYIRCWFYSTSETQLHKYKPLYGTCDYDTTEVLNYHYIQPSSFEIQGNLLNTSFYFSGVQVFSIQLHFVPSGYKLFRALSRALLALFCKLRELL